MESGTPGGKATDDGWLNRALQTMPEKTLAISRRSFRTVSAAHVARHRFRDLDSGPQAIQNERAAADHRRRFRSDVRANGRSRPARRRHGNFRSRRPAQKNQSRQYQPENGAQYPKGRFGQSLQEIAELFKADVGLEVAFLDSGGWDHHVNEGGVQGQLSNLLRDLGQGVAAFHQDMGDRMGDVVFVSMSEFGRTAHENGNRGTDHGHANCMFVMGGDIKGGKVYTRWPGLDEAQLNQGRDLAVTTDYRSVLGEIIANHLGDRDLNAVFPGFANDPRQFLGLVKT